MAYKDSSLNFTGYLDIQGNKKDKDIFDLLVAHLGQPQIETRFNHFPSIEDGKEISGIQLFLDDDSHKLIIEKLKTIGILFEDVFERDWGHFHPSCCIEDKYYECTAFGNEDGWELYYEDEKEGFGWDKRIYIGFVNKTEINELDDIDEIFKKWLKNYLGYE